MRVFLFALGALAVVSTPAADLITPQDAIPGQYIVVLNKDAEDQRQNFNESDIERRHARWSAEAGELNSRYGGTTRKVFRRALKGYVASMGENQARALRNDPRVRYIEQDSIVRIAATELNPPWGLDRIDQRDLPVNGSYNYSSTGAGIHAYIIDTGIRSTHVEFFGRVGVGFSAIADGRGTADCNGHGTHVTGIVAGVRYGVAKQAIVHPVRVLGCDGSGSTSGVIAGVDWVTSNHLSPAVANMSLGGSTSTAMDDAVRSSIASGVTYAIAAGNANTNACNFSPARVTQALTVGATASNDTRASYSNIGACLDVFAPGSGIVSAWNKSDTATATLSGTSMATPHVTGVAALLLQQDPSASPASIAAAIVSNASVSKLAGIGNGSPNRLLNSSPGAVQPPDPPPSASFTQSCTNLVCSFDASASTDNAGITSYAWNFGDGTTGSGVNVSHTFGAAGTYTVILTVTDTASQTSSASRSATVTSPDPTAPCATCAHYTGSLSRSGAEQFQPRGTYYFAATAGTHRGYLTGPAGANFDLYLWRWNGSRWVVVAQSTGPTSREDITYNGRSAYYTWSVYSRQGKGSYDFYLQQP